MQSTSQYRQTERRQRAKLKITCESKLQLLRDSMATVETLRVARQEIRELLMTTTGTAVARSKHQIKKIKAACTAARLRFTEHQTPTAANSFTSTPSKLARLNTFEQHHHVGLVLPGGGGASFNARYSTQ